MKQNDSPELLNLLLKHIFYKNNPFPPIGTLRYWKLPLWRLVSSALVPVVPRCPCKPWALEARRSWKPMGPLFPFSVFAFRWFVCISFLGLPRGGGIVYVIFGYSLGYLNGRCVWIIGLKAPGNYSASFWSNEILVLLCEGQKPNISMISESVNPWSLVFMVLIYQVTSNNIRTYMGTSLQDIFTYLDFHVFVIFWKGGHRQMMKIRLIKFWNHGDGTNIYQKTLMLFANMVPISLSKVKMTFF